MTATYGTDSTPAPRRSMTWLGLPTLWRWIRIANRYPLIPMGIMALMIIGAIFAPLVAPFDPENGYLGDREIPPFWGGGEASFKHLLGTDQQGRDLLSRVIFGARISMIIVLIVVAVGASVGTVLGISAAWYGRHVDEVIMRLVDFTLAMPFILVALVAVIVFGQSFTIVIVLLAMFSWNGYTRQIRADALTIKAQDYVSAALVAGAPTRRIMTKHIFPGIVNTLIVVATLRVGSLILAEAILSFLGVGIPKPTPAWGVMVADGRDYLGTSWWIAFFPGFAIFLLVLSGNFLGDWLRDKLDPRLRQIH
jgi:peptide/nickel transport system permease protein